MNTENLIIISIIVGIIIISAIVFCHFKNKPKREINLIKEKYPRQLAVLLDKENIKADTIISDEEEQRILSLSREDWELWAIMIQKALNLSTKYASDFDTYLEEDFPYLYKRKCFSNYRLEKTLVKRESLVKSMTMHELSLVLADSEEEWTKRKTAYQKAAEIKRSYKDGYAVYCETRNDKPQTSDILQNEGVIKEYQKYYELSKIYVGWEEEQKTFSKNYYQICKKSRSNDGKFKYIVPFNKPTKTGQIEKSKFLVWQGFVQCFSDFYKELQPQYMISQGSLVPEFKQKQRYFKEAVYESIFEIIKSIDQTDNTEVLVILVDRSMYNWSQDIYTYHYKSIERCLNECLYDYCYFSDLYTIPKTTPYTTVFLIDFITCNEDLKNNCAIVAEYFEKKVPSIGYYSLVKEYTEDEVKKYCKKEEESKPKPAPAQPPLEPQPQEGDIAFVKKMFGLVNKHSFFSYTAITNTLIGEAAGASRIKPAWLSNPDKYHITILSSLNTIIKVKYSTDSQKNFTEYSFEGRKESIDDVSVFTYKLFIKMGVWDEFKQRGEKALRLMNEKGLLAYH